MSNNKNLQVRCELATFAGLLSPGLFTCRLCRLPWSVVSHHITEFPDGRGCFPLCELCWSLLVLESRLVYYREWFDSLSEEVAATFNWEEIKAAVLEGK